MSNEGSPRPQGDRRIWPGVIVLAAAGVAALLFFTAPRPARRPTAPHRPLVVVARLAPADRCISLRASGRVEPVTRISLLPQVTGRVARVHPHFVPGGRVPAGQPLVTLEVQEYAAALQQTRADLRTATEELRLELARQASARAELKTFRGKGMSEAQRDLVIRGPQRRIREAAVDSARAKVKLAELNVRRTRIAFSVVLLAACYVASGRLGYQSFPTVESDFAEASAMLPYGTPSRQTERVVRRMVSAARRIGQRPENRGLVVGIFADRGRGGSHNAMVRVYLAPPEVREATLSTVAFVRAWRKLVGEVPGVEPIRFSADAGGPSRGHSLSLELSHRDPSALAGAADMIMRMLGEYPIVADVNHDFLAGQPQNDVRLNSIGRAMGLDAQSLARQLRAQLYGVESRRQLRGRDEVVVTVRGTEQERTSLRAFERTLVKTPSGTFVPLGQVASVTRGSANTKIERRHGSRVVDVDADIDPPARTNHIMQQVDEVIMPEVQKRYPA